MLPPTSARFSGLCGTALLTSLKDLQPKWAWASLGALVLGSSRITIARSVPSSGSGRLTRAPVQPADATWPTTSNDLLDFQPTTTAVTTMPMEWLMSFNRTHGIPKLCLERTCRPYSNLNPQNRPTCNAWAEADAGWNGPNLQRWNCNCIRMLCSALMGRHDSYRHFNDAQLRKHYQP